MNRLFTIILLTSLLAINAPRAYAQSIVVSPATQEIIASKGDKKEGIVKISNTTDQVLEFSVASHDFTVSDQNGTPQFSSQDSPYALSRWIGITPSKFELEPGASQEVYYFVSIPQNAEPGGYYAGIVAAASGSTTTATAQIKNQVVSLVSVIVKGDKNPTWTLSVSTPSSFVESGPIRVETVIRNNGNVHVRPEGRITITSILGTKILDQSIPKKNIFPKNSTLTESVLNSWILIGPYTIKVVAVDTLFGGSKEASYIIWVFPWKATTALVVLIIAGLLIKKRFKIHEL